MELRQGIELRNPDVVTDEMAVASSKVAGLALNGLQAERKAS
jgi:hypothetical protein